MKIKFENQIKIQENQLENLSKEFESEKIKFSKKPT